MQKSSFVSHIRFIPSLNNLSCLLPHLFFFLFNFDSINPLFSLKKGKNSTKIQKFYFGKSDRIILKFKGCFNFSRRCRWDGVRIRWDGFRQWLVSCHCACTMKNIVIFLYISSTNHKKRKIHPVNFCYLDGNEQLY